MDKLLASRRRIAIAEREKRITRLLRHFRSVRVAVAMQMMSEGIETALAAVQPLREKLSRTTERWDALENGC